MRRGVVVVLLALAACSSSARRTAPVKSTTSARSTADTTSTTVTPPLSSTSTSTTQPARQPLWTDRRLTITAQTLGAVRVGMSVAEAQAAAGAVFDGMGDGAAYPTTLPAGYAHLVVDGDPIFCVAAFTGATPSAADVISTPEGFELGGTVATLRGTYGARLRHIPEPPSGISPSDGYVVAEPGGYLVFMVSTSGVVDGIAGGQVGFSGRPITPSTCIG